MLRMTINERMKEWGKSEGWSSTFSLRKTTTLQSTASSCRACSADRSGAGRPAGNRNLNKNVSIFKKSKN